MNIRSLFRFTVILAIVAMPFAAFAANIGRPSGGGNVIEWQLDLRGQAAIELRIIAPSGQEYTATSKGGLNPSFRLSQLGADLEDGVYNYELRGVPQVSADVAQKLAVARKAGDDAAARKIMKAAGLETITQSGAFTVLNGSIVDPNQTESDANDNATISGRGLGVTTDARPSTPTVNDQVIADDLIVQGSGCFGFDCVNNESFGFDTIRLKENNLRIKAEDTSVGTFPTNDWQLTFNDSASGGQSKFSVEDITGAKVPMTVEAGATTNSVYVDSTGRVGFRTSTPVLDLHVNTSNTPAIRLEQNNSGGFTAQTWDIAGNEANFFVRDVTSGSRLPFRIRPGAPTSSIDIAADGKVGIGTASPSEKLHIKDTAAGVTIGLVENSAAADATAAIFRTKSDTAQMNTTSHSSLRVLSRFGQNVGGWNEVLGVTGNGLLIGTNTATPLILGTNNASRLEIGSAGGVTVNGNFTVTGIKSFAMPDPADRNRAIYYVALEGPEAGTYFRGTAHTVNGEAVIELPGYFSRITEAERMTVQLTANGQYGQLFVAEKTPSRLVIKVAEGTADLAFDYLVQGVRKGYLDFEIERDNDLPK